jgi:hypothetical protein
VCLSLLCLDLRERVRLLCPERLGPQLSGRAGLGEVELEVPRS